MGEDFCRGCLIQYDNSSELLQYTEKNRRLYVYSTGLQVKRNDTFTFQLCKDCFLNMKLACKFKKQCRNSDKKHKQFLALKEAGEVTDLCSYLKANDDSLVLRYPLWSESNTPQKARDDDNESTCTSIRNFMTDLLKADDIPDTEAKIIREVIEEEAEMLDDSLDSHWLQDDVSVVSDFRLDFSLSPFTTPRSVNEDNFNPQKLLDSNTGPTIHYVPKLILPPITDNKPIEEIDNDEDDAFIQELVLKDKAMEMDCVIDKNMENALKNDKAVYALDDLLVTPSHNGFSAASTPSITNILFGNKASDPSGQQIEPYEHMSTDYDALEELLEDKYVPQFYIQPKDLEEEEHIKTEEKIEDKITRIEEERVIDDFTCEVCAKQFKSGKSLKIHKRAKHDIVLPRKRPTEKKDYMCDYCAHICHSLTMLRKHVYHNHKRSTIEKKTACEHCSREFFSELSLKHHMLTHNTRTETKFGVRKEFPCSKCDAVFNYKCNLKVHEMRHNKQYSLHCIECGRGFYKNSELKRHELSHIGVYNFECNICGKKFLRSDGLTSHLKVHTGERPFICDNCTAGFSTLAVLRKHIHKGCRKDYVEE